MSEWVGRWVGEMDESELEGSKHFSCILMLNL